jgi:hypothetical protein
MDWFSSAAFRIVGLLSVGGAQKSIRAILSSSRRTSSTVFLAVNLLDLRQNGFSSQVIKQGQDIMKQAFWYSNIGQLESNITAMADDLDSDLHQLHP